MIVRDAYVDFEINEGMCVKIGKFKSPIGQEHLQPTRYLMFTERALPTDLIPDRGIGIHLRRNILSKIVRAQLSAVP